MDASRPVIALVARREPDRFLQLAAAVRRWCHVVALGQEELGPPDAIVAASPWVDLPAGLPFAIWVEGEEELTATPVAERAQAVLATRAELLTGLGPRGVLVPTGDPIAGAAYVSPFVRQRLRRGRALPEDPVLEQVGGAWWWPGREQPLSAWLVPTALACAAAACLESPDALVVALASGTPTVTDEATAAAVGAVPGRHVLAAGTAMDRRLLAENLAADLASASRISWEGRCYYESRDDMPRAAIRLIGRLLPPGGARGGSPANVQLLLDELNTPLTAAIRSRLADAVAGLPVFAQNGA